MECYNYVLWKLKKESNFMVTLKPLLDTMLEIAHQIHLRTRVDISLGKIQRKPSENKKLLYLILELFFKPSLK